MMLRSHAIIFASLFGSACIVYRPVPQMHFRVQEENSRFEEKIDLILQRLAFKRVDEPDSGMGPAGASFRRNQIHVTYFLERDDRWMVTCSEHEEEKFSHEGRSLCESVGMQLKSAFSKVSDVVNKEK